MPAGLFALCFILYTTYRVLNRRTGTTWIHMLLAFGAIASFANAPTMLMLIIGGAVALTGFILLPIEQRRAQPDFNQSQGIFTIGFSVLLLISALAGPTIASTLTQLTQEAVATAQESNEANTVAMQPTEMPVQNAVVLVTNTPVPTLTPEAVAVSLSNPLPTRYVFTTPVPTATVVNTARCEGITENNLNLRAEPAADAELLLTIPHSMDVPVYGRNEESSWLYTDYDGVSGWVSADYVILSADCGDLPIQAS